MFPNWSNYDIQYTRKGLIKKWIRRALSSLIFVAGIITLYQARKHGQTFASAYGILQQQARGLITVLLTTVERGVRIIQNGS